MPSFNENVDIRGHDLVVYDDSNTEIARLDHEGTSSCTMSSRDRASG